MKKVSYILLIILATIFYSCNDMDMLPPNVLGDKDLFTSESGVDAYMARIYEAIPIEAFTYTRTNGFKDWTHFDGLGQNTGEFMNSEYCYGSEVRSGFNWWPYAKIRDINYFLENFETNSSLPAEEISHYKGEAYFLRAYYYFSLAKRYGGVPIIDRVQKYPEESLESLKVSRNKEEDVWNFILSDLDKAYDLMLPKEFKNKSRASKYAAAALKSRVALYAGTIAKYGTVQLNGLIGIPKDKAANYFKQSYDAAKLLEVNFELYRNNPDKTKNYHELFFDTNSKEAIFVKEYQFIGVGGVNDRTHSYNFYAIPHQLTRNGWGSTNNPTVKFVELFGELKVNDSDGKPIRFNTVQDYLATIEPRLRASVLFPGETFRGEEITVQGGVYENYPGQLITATSYDALHNGKHIMGKSGLAHTYGTYTGFHMKKYLKEEVSDIEYLDWRDETDWLAIRYAEVLLNRAEAACELYLEGQGGADYLQDAFTQINDIRDRAGATLLVNKSELQNIEIVRTERRKELAFENHSWWDFIRWRTAHTLVDHVRYNTTFAPYYILGENKYIFRKSELDILKNEWTFPVKLYYEGIPQSEINKNPNLLPNNPQY